MVKFKFAGMCGTYFPAQRWVKWGSMGFQVEACSKGLGEAILAACDRNGVSI